MPSVKLPPMLFNISKDWSPCAPLLSSVHPGHVGSDGGMDAASGFIGKLKNPKLSAEAVSGGFPISQASCRKVLILQAGFGSAQHGKCWVFLCLAGGQESLPARGRAEVPTEGDSDAITMFLAGLAFWSNRELLGQILQGVVREHEWFTNLFQQVWGGEDIMCLLSRECTNCVFPL